MCFKNSLVLSAFVTLRTYPNRVASENDKEAISFLSPNGTKTYLYP